MSVIVYCDGGLGNRIRGLVNACIEPGTLKFVGQLMIVVPSFRSFQLSVYQYC